MFSYLKISHTQYAHLKCNQLQNYHNKVYHSKFVYQTIITIINNLYNGLTFLNNFNIISGI